MERVVGTEMITQDLTLEFCHPKIKQKILNRVPDEIVRFHIIQEKKIFHEGKSGHYIHY